ncbi:hypothetical protein J6590_003887 [Homalodisca vitripennis]|nr:hypothetical protein J6590_003887 [Homalodisca vitripennis]
MVLWLLGVPMVERSKTLDFGSELEIARVRILSVTVVLFISTIDLVLYRLFHVILFDKTQGHEAHEDGQKALRRISLSLKENNGITKLLITNFQFILVTSLTTELAER